MAKLVRGLVVLAMVVPLGSCTTLSTGILASPPGIHRYSFRECLLDNGFFTPTALDGTARSDYIDRHVGDVRVSPRRDAVLAMSDAAFIAESGTVIFQGLLPHQQFGGEAGKANVLNHAGDRPYAENLAGEPYKPEGFAAKAPPDFADDHDMAEHRMNRYLDCYIGPVGAEPQDMAPGPLDGLQGDKDLEGRLLRAHILLAMLSAYGTELVTSHASSKQPAYAAMLLKHIANAEMELRIASPVWNNAALKGMGAATAFDTDHPGALTYAGDEFRGAQAVLRWDDSVTRILRVFQVAKDTQVIDVGQTLDRLTNIVAAISKPATGLFQGLLKDSLKGLGAMQKISLYGDAMLRDGRETLAAHRLDTTYDKATKAFTLGNGQAAMRGWKLWDAQIRRSCAVLAAVAKDSSATCVPSEQAVKEETARRARLLNGEES